ncbi:MAG: aminoglycoside 3'-phosphotransferase/choline kinase family protein [Vitreoscilla sp.]|nr:aminoglycoside 3'-phosphotransferase/choline kinase family protein [Vitreoscilla sp.]
MKLPASIGVEAFDALHDDIPRWQDLIASIAAEHSAAPVRPMEEGTVLVALVGTDLVVKLYPPFLRDHFEFERAALGHLHGQLSVPTPRLVAHGERDGWPYTVMTQLAGQPLTEVWPELAEAQKCGLLTALGRLAAEVHALPVAGMAALAPEWGDFIAGQRARCRQRQQRTGLPAHLLALLEPFVAGELPAGPPVILTGEYTPMNLLYGPAATGGLAGMFDFGDGLVGPREYDWLGPLCFLAAGQPARLEAFFGGYGATPGRAERLALLRLLLLHRYSCLRAQIACPGWERAESFEALAELIWPTAAAPDGAVG